MSAARGDKKILSWKEFFMILGFLGTMLSHWVAMKIEFQSLRDQIGFLKFRIEKLEEGRSETRATVYLEPPMAILPSEEERKKKKIWTL